jgi:histidine triad (HIT) family protein
MLNEKETEKIKKQLIKHIEESFPVDKRDFAIQKIISMSPLELEDFLTKNNLLRKEVSVECVFCGIVGNIIESKKIAESKNSIAVLEINPLSKGHTLIIPKKHISSFENLPKDVWNLSKKISKIIKKRLKPKNIKLESLNFLGHEVINVIPIYEDEKNLERKRASTDELESLKEILTERIKVDKKKDNGFYKKSKKSNKSKEELIFIKPRIP